jgi:hypothetical protein
VEDADQAVSEGAQCGGVGREFPFTRSGAPSRLVGRDAIMAFVVASWEGLLKYERYQTLSAIRRTTRIPSLCSQTSMEPVPLPARSSSRISLC